MMESDVPVRPGWRQVAARVGSARGIMDAGLALGGVHAAAPRLRPWLTYHGALVEDVDTAIRGAFSLGAWRRRWERVAARRADVAAAAARGGHSATAFRHGVAAAVAYQSAPYLVPHDAAALERCIAAAACTYADAVAHAPWPVRAVNVPWREHALPAWLHLPRDVDAASPPPVVVAENTIGHYKETWTGLARALTERGVAVLAFDAPGTGERGDLAAPLHVEHILTPVRDHLDALETVDASRAGLFGISLAGNTVARAAALDARWAAVASITPPFDPSRYAHTLPRFILQFLAHRAKLTPRRVIARAHELSLTDVAHRITQPLFVVDANNDYLVPTGEGERLVNAAASKEKTLVTAHDRGGHAGILDFHRVMDAAADFLARALRA